jgi:transcriptional regulator with XRE-family HTH domain
VGAQVSRPRFDGKLLARLREGREMTMRELAAASGVNASSIHRIEHGRDPSFEHAVTLARFFGLKVDAFVKDET